MTTPILNVADELNHLHQQFTQTSNTALELVVRIGELLTTQKDSMPHGQWIPWLQANVAFDRMTAFRYMRVYNESKCNTVLHLGVTEVYRMLAGPKAAERQAARESNPKTVEQMDGFITDLSQAKGTFGCIYADPPWKYDNQGTRSSTNNHYSTMTVDDLCALPVAQLSADKCHLHLWTTNAFLFECPKIFAAWGFEFKSSFVWVKPQMGIGNYWRNSHEIMLLAVKGGLTAQDKGLMSWMQCGRGRHSSKPDEIRSLIERLSPGPRLELFGRRKVDGWVVFGNEILDML